MNLLRVTTVQVNLYWENASANLQKLEEKLDDINTPTDLILLPEMFTTGFSMRPEIVAEEMEGPSMKWMHKQAVKLRAAVAGSLVIKEDGNYYNRFVFMLPDGSFQTYDKRHLFGMGDEDRHYTAGNQNIIIEYRGWRIMPQICYDLRFPVWSRNTMAYDLLIYVANWPEKRNFAWKNLLQARAIENQAYVIGVNRIGRDVKETAHSGDTMVFDPYAETPLYSVAYQEAVTTHILDKEKIKEVRTKLPFLPDRDQFEFIV